MDPSLAEIWQPPEIKTAREVCEIPLPEGESVWGPVWPGYRLIIAGNPGQGKTTFCFAVVRAVAHGETFLDWQGCGGRVLVIDTEMGLRSVQKALTKSGLDDSDVVDYARVPDGLELDSSPAQLEWLNHEITERQPVMVVIDPLYKAHGGDSNDERQMIDLMRKLDKLRDAHGFVLVIPMHLRKTDPRQPDFGLNDVFGSGAFTRGPEVVLGIRKKHPGASRLLFLKDRDGDMSGAEAWNLSYSPADGFERDKDDEIPVPVQIARAFLVNGDGVMTLDQIAAAIGSSRKTARDHLAGMMADGLVSETEKKGPHGVKLYVIDHMPPGMEEFDG